MRNFVNIISVKQADRILHMKQNESSLVSYSYHSVHLLMHLNSFVPLFQSIHAILEANKIAAFWYILFVWAK